jgi:molybdenum ABC transporter molybdate-binding protein
MLFIALAVVLASAGLPLVVHAQTPAPGSTPSQAQGFADPAFQATWERTDKFVADGLVRRGYFWGPQPGAIKTEQYAQGQGGARLVQYFDKSRMEINNPNGDRSNRFFVTNGLLTVELETGNMQVGDNEFIARAPAEIPLASDTDDPNAPTYATFGKLMAPAPNKVGSAQVQRVDRAGNVTTSAGVQPTQQQVIAYYEPQTGHNIPKVFWDFLNATGPVYENGKAVSARLSDPWYYASGLPISEPYWASVKIGGVQGVDVYIQAYQRRVLTYVPSAPAGFQVQVGNIGQHYYDWRYNQAGNPAPTAAPTQAAPPVPQPTLASTGLTVFAASSLTDAFNDAGKSFQANNPSVTGLRFNFAGSQALVAQLQQGAPADVFASADKATMDNAQQAGVLDGLPHELARNSLVVVMPNQNSANIASLQDLARPGIKLSLADPSVPVGSYTLQMLDKLSADPAYGPDFKQHVLDNVVSRENDVRQVLTRVQMGEADAGVVYLTDALAANAGIAGNLQPVQTLQIPEQYNVVAIYYIAHIKGAAHPDTGQAWIAYILSPAGQDILTRYGFLPEEATP